MFVKVSPPPVGDNKGSCQKLANYLSKEEGSFFDGEGNDVSYANVIDSIDQNASRGLRKVDDKFYMLAINPSHEELEHIIGRKVKNASELTQIERDKIESSLKDYTQDVMDIYAKNFDRPDKVTGKNDILYFGRVETERTYSFTDPEVENGLKKAGENKEGLNYHVHVIVSRKSANRHTKLSPLAKSAGNEWIKDDRLLKRGFSHERFKLLSQEKFSERFNYISDKPFIISNPNKEHILSTIYNNDLKDILKNNFFQDPNQVSFLMQERGYTKSFNYGKFIYTKEGVHTAIAYKEIKPFCSDIPKDNIDIIVNNFDLYKFEKDPASYRQDGVNIEERICRNKETNKDYKYYILHDNETKTSVNISTIINYAKENNISLVNRKYLDSIENKDLRECLSYNIKNVHELKTLMTDRNYEMKFEKGHLIFERNITPLKNESIDLSYKHFNSFIDFKKELRDDAVKDFSTLTNINELRSEKLSSLSYRIIQNISKENPFKQTLIDNLEKPDNLVLRNKINIDFKPTKLVVDEISKDVFSVNSYRENLNVTNFKVESVLEEVTNSDLKDILSNNSFQNHSQVSFLMQQRGYESTIEYGKYSFSKDGSSFQIAIKKIIPFSKNEFDKDSLTRICKNFNAYEFSLNPSAYKQDGIIIQSNEFTDKEGNLRFNYSLHDINNKTSVSVSSLQEFAYRNNIQIHDFRVEILLSKISNDDLKSILIEHNISNPSDVSFWMKSHGYTVSYDYGKYNFSKDGEHFQISGSLIKEFSQKASFESLSNIAQRFNLYKFELLTADYKPEGIEIEKRTFQRQYSDGWKTESYYVIHDTNTKTSINVSELKHFASKNNIPLVTKSDIDLLPNIDLKESLHYNLRNIYDLKLLMSEKGYQVTNEDRNIVFTKMETKISVSSEVLHGMIEFNREERMRSISKLCSEKDVFNLTHETLKGSEYILTNNTILNKQAQFERNTLFKDFLSKDDENCYVLSSTKPEYKTRDVLNNGVNPLKEKDYVIDTKSGNISEKSIIQQYQKTKSRNKSNNSQKNLLNGNIANKVKSTVTNAVLQDTFATERKMISQVSKVGKNVNQAIGAIVNPKAAISNLTIQTAKSIVSGILQKGISNEL